MGSRAIRCRAAMRRSSRGRSGVVRRLCWARSGGGLVTARVHREDETRHDAGGILTKDPAVAEPATLERPGRALRSRHVARYGAWRLPAENALSFEALSAAAGQPLDT